MAYEDEVLGLQQQQETARKIRERAQMPTGQMAGGWYVPPSNMQYLAEALKQFTGAYQEGKARREEKALKAQHEADIESALSEGVGTPENYARLLRTDPQMAQGLMAYEKANKPEVEKAPTGTRLNEQGQLEPMPMAGYGDYANYQMQLAGAKAQIPSYGEPQRLSMDQERLQMQREEAQARRAAANQPKQMSEFQAYALEEKKAKKQAEHEDALVNIDNSINDLDNLIELQKKTTTGRFLGSDPVVAIREALPESIGGGENLQKLETGYNKASLQAIGTLKQGGTTLGAMSKDEGAWVRSTEASLKRGAAVNIAHMEEGKRLLQAQKERIARRMPLETFIKQPDANTTPEDAAALRQLQQKTGGQFVNYMPPVDRGSIGGDEKQQRLNALRAKHGLQ
jgi:hypothetical protein